MAPSKKNTITVSLEDVCCEKLGIELNQSIDQIALIERTCHPKRTKPFIWVVVEDGQLYLACACSVKKVLAWAGGLPTAIFALVKAITWAMPLIQAYLLRTPGP